MKALSIKQPWAWLICAGYKNIENRDWRIGRKPAPGRASVSFELPVPQRVYVHAGRTFDYDGFNAVCEWIGKGRVPSVEPNAWAEVAVHPYLGVPLGEVDITACVTESESPWFVGKYGFVLANPVLYERPIPYRGALGFFEVQL